MNYTESFQKLNLKLFKDPILPSKDISELQKELASTNTQVKAMRTILSMIQNNIDMGVLCSDILKIIDTKDPVLKYLCNIYLKYNVMNRPACQIMCTNVFLKDFNDRNWEIQRQAINEAVNLADEVIAKNYVYDIKRMAMQKRNELRSASAYAIGLLYHKSNEIFFENGFDKIIRKLSIDKNLNVSNTALNSILSIEAQEDFLTLKEIIRLVELFENTENQDSLRTALAILRFKTINIDLKPILLRLMKHSDLSIFYLSSSKLLEIDSSAANEIFNQATLFLNSRNEQLFNLLIYIDSLLKDLKLYGTIEYNNSLFVISEYDPNYIKRLKIKILFRKLDELAKSEIRRHISEEEHFLQIFELSLSKNIIFEELFENIKPIHQESVFSQILRKDPMPEELKVQIENYIYNLKEVIPIRLFLELAAKFCSLIPGFVFKIQEKEYSKELIRFYAVFFERGKISQLQCVNYLKNISDTLPNERRAKILLKNIENLNSEECCQIFLDEPNNKQEISLNHSKARKDKDILNCRPYKDSFNMNEETYEEEVKNLPLFIDIDDYKGMVYMLNDKIYLETDILEKPHKISIELGNMKEEKLLTKEEKVLLHEIKLEDINNYFNILIENRVFKIFLEMKKLARPFLCSKEDFELNYSKLTSCAISEIKNLENFHRIDEKRLVFSLVGNDIYAKQENEQWTVKCEEKLIHFFKK